MNAVILKFQSQKEIRRGINETCTMCQDFIPILNGMLFVILHPEKSLQGTACKRQFMMLFLSEYRDLSPRK